MPELPPEQVTPFVFSDPSGKRWPRLRLILPIGGVQRLILRGKLKTKSLFLYVYDDAKGVNETERVKDIAKRWVQCIRNRIRSEIV
jgi:hypothetical protein